MGTGSSRALIYSVSKKEVVSTVSISAEIDQPAPSRAEFVPAKWRDAALRAMAEAVAHAKSHAEDYLGITVTSLRQGFVLMDKVGVPLGPGVLNYDRRGALGIPRIREKCHIEELYALTGHWHAPELTLPKLIYYQEYEPDTWDKVEKILFVHDWMLYELTGEICTNATMACAGQMADVSNRTWAFDLLTELGIPDHILPPLMEAGTLIGGLQEEVAHRVGLSVSTPVFVGGGDAQFGSLGAGGMHPDSVVIVGGSTTPLILTTDAPVLDPKKYPWVSTHLAPGLWAIEMNAGSTGRLYKWFRDTFGTAQVEEAERRGEGSFEVLNELALKAPLGTNGLRAIASSPRWAQDTWEKKAPYMFLGFNTGHSLGEFGRAILESVCYAVRGNLEELERIRGTKSEKIIYTGGTAAPTFWAQMMSDVIGRTLHVPEIEEPAASAGAQVVLKGLGDDAVMLPPGYREYHPDEDTASEYQHHYEDYVTKFEAVQKNFAQEV
jgi:sugar (pentulose or hexulose) kinase